MSLDIGKGMYIWKVPSCEGGDVAKIVATAKAANLGHVLIKVADAAIGWNYANGVDLVKPLVQALKAAGIQPWGWGYVYGANPGGEADKAIQRIRELGLVGYVTNAEKEYRDRVNNKYAATYYMARLRAGVGSDFPLGLSSYRYPSYHPTFPWNEFLSAVDVNMPQVYWMQATNAGYQLRRSVTEFGLMKHKRPIVPTGAAFSEHGWTATPAEIKDFLNVAKELELPAANFWSWQHARSIHVLWEAVADYDWPAPFPPVPAPPEPVYPRIARVVSPVTQRGDYSTDSAAYGLIPSGIEIRVHGTRQIGADEWAWLNAGQSFWCAVVYRGRRYLEWVT